MSKLIALDDGHGMETPGKRTPVVPGIGRVIKENEFNRAVVNFLDQELRRCGFRTLLVAPGDNDVPLKARTDLANAKGADAYISVHYNALSGTFEKGGKGIETFIYTSVKDGSPTHKLGTLIHRNLMKGTPFVDRGLKRADFHVLRETKMPAVLVECGFMDNVREAQLMLDVNYQKECAREIAQAICEFFGVKYVPEAAPAPKPDPAPTAKDPLVEALEVLKSKGIEFDLKYWSENARPGKTCNGEYVGILLQRIANKLKG